MTTRNCPVNPKANIRHIVWELAVLAEIMQSLRVEDSDDIPLVWLGWFGEQIERLQFLLDETDNSQ